MVIYGIIVLIVGLGLLSVSILLILRKVKVLYTYHYDNVKEEDQKKFAFYLGLSLLVASIVLIVSAILAFSLQAKMALWIHAIIDFVALIASFCLVLLFTKKYNGKVLTPVKE